jgi:hypothetical protein
MLLANPKSQEEKGETERVSSRKAWRKIKRKNNLEEKTPTNY